MVKHSFTKKERLKKNNSIKDVFDKGVPCKGRLITIFLLEKHSGPQINRVAFTVRKDLYDKKVVLKNRFRRLLREAYRKTKHILPIGYDLVILATNLTTKTKSTAIEREMTDVFKRDLKK